MFFGVLLNPFGVLTFCSKAMASNAMSSVSRCFSTSETVGGLRSSSKSRIKKTMAALQLMPVMMLKDFLCSLLGVLESTVC